MFMTICVTQEDISNGWVSSCSRCPIALALKRSFPALEPFVEWDKAKLFDKISGETVHWINLPKKASEFIERFDSMRRYTPIKPFSFRIRV